MTASPWLPPPQPDPFIILQEAKADADADRHAEALAKHLWFHAHALEIDPAFSGVRLSFALAFWMELGRRYPPALVALKDLRDAAVSRLRAGDPDWADFHDVAAINESLDEQDGTAELFVWLDGEHPDFARTAYRVAQPALVRTGRYRLCGKFIDTQQAVADLLQLYRENVRMAAESEAGQELHAYGERSLSHGASTLVALLVLNGRAAEADEAMDPLLEARPDECFRQELESARTGVLPAPWPVEGD